MFVGEITIFLWVFIVNWGTLVPHLQVIAIFAGADLRDFPGKLSDLGGFPSL